MHLHKQETLIAWMRLGDTHLLHYTHFACKGVRLGDTHLLHYTYKKDMDYGFITVASAVPVVRVADPKQNIKEIERLVEEAERKGVEIIVFPELSVTGYSCQDLFGNQTLLRCAEEAVASLKDFTADFDLSLIHI